jgi:thiamine kinase-like enzyme
MQSCQARGCFKKYQIRYRYNGWFCKQHLKKLQEIRQQIEIAKKTPWSLEKLTNEQHWRQEEFFLRDLDWKHYQLLCDLKENIDDFLHRNKCVSLYFKFQAMIKV